MRRVMALAVGIPLLVVGAAQFGALSGQPPADLGVVNGRLKPPSDTRNSVSSQADLYANHPQGSYAAIEPLPFKTGGTAVSLAALEQTLLSQPGISIVERKPDYLRAEARTRWLGFVDDLEFWANPRAGAIELRSASRLGREDFGTNRERIEALRARYQAVP